MEIIFNGQCVNVNSRYDSPYTKVWQKEKESVYWVQIPNSEAFKVHNIISDTIKKHGRERWFWDELGTILESSFRHSFICSDKSGQY